MIDYSIEPYRDNGERDGEYRMSHQLFSYGVPNFKVNAAIEEIIAPSEKDAYSRINPVCGNPVIRIQNKGQQPLKSLDIRYGQTGRRLSNYEWVGELEFMEATEIVLPAPRWKNLEAGGRFEVTVSRPNNTNDEDLADNTLTSRIPGPLVLPQVFTLQIQTNDNNRSRENECTITDSDGGLHFVQYTFTDSTLYEERIQLEKGCYQFRFTDRYEDGIMQHWWYRNSNPELVGISGSVKILDQSGETVLKEFSPDFGEQLLLNFIVE